MIIGNPSVQVLLDNTTRYFFRDSTGRHSSQAPLLIDPPFGVTEMSCHPSAAPDTTTPFEHERLIELRNAMRSPRSGGRGRVVHDLDGFSTRAAGPEAAALRRSSASSASGASSARSSPRLARSDGRRRSLRCAAHGRRTDRPTTGTIPACGALRSARFPSPGRHPATEPA